MEHVLGGRYIIYAASPRLAGAPRSHTPGGAGQVALGGMCGIVLSFPVAFFVYRALAGIAWVGLLNLLGVFLIAGIGADDIFVVWEHWKQAPVRD